MSTIIIPNIAIFKEGEVYVYTLPEDYMHIHDDDLLHNGKCSICKKYNEAVSYARAHPFKVAEKDKGKVMHKMYLADGHPIEGKMWVPQYLTEYRIEGLRMEIKEVVDRIKEYPPKTEHSEMCGDITISGKDIYYKQVACLISDDGVKKQPLTVEEGNNFERRYPFFEDDGVKN